MVETTSGPKKIYTVGPKKISSGLQKGTIASQYRIQDQQQPGETNLHLYLKLFGMCIYKNIARGTTDSGY